MAEHKFLELVDPADGSNWQIDAGFLTSNWQCIWGCGCQGIDDEANPDAMLGCCSVGVVLPTEDDAQTTAALGATLDPALFQYAAEAAANGTVEQDDNEWATRVVDGACIFLNRPGFSGGAGCALHIAALAEGEDPIDYKPTTCWKLPIRTERRTEDGVVSHTLRAWRRGDFGEGGETMAWWCTEAAEAFTAEQPVIITLRPQLERVLGEALLRQVETELGQ